MNKNVKWVIETNILVGSSYENLPQVVKDAGYEVFETKFEPFTRKIETIPYSNDECVVVYGSFNYVNLLSRSGYRFIPGAYGITSDTNCSYYIPLLSQEFILNNDYIMMSWGEFVRRKDFLVKLYGEKLFVRPNSGFKTFSGFAFDTNEWDYEINTRQALTSVMHDTLVLISSCKEIYSEYRFVIADRKIVTGSQYHQNGKLYESEIVDDDCKNFVLKVAENNWQLDTCYTCDVGLTSNGPKLIELNSFGCAGLYKCDLQKIAHSVSKAAIKDFYDV